MKKLFVADLKTGDSIFGEIFAVKSYVKKSSRNNRPYIDIELTDKTGTINGKIWADDFANCESVEAGQVVSVNGTIDEFNGPQIKVTNLTVTEKYDIEDIQQKSQFDIEEMWGTVQKTIDAIKNPHIKSLLKNVFDAETTEKYKKSSAGLYVHHGYYGGLLEHVTEMLEMAKSLKYHFPKINMDIVNAGIILHDLGKSMELEMSTAITFTDPGKLWGHIYLGASKTQESAPSNMPKDLLTEIVHVILSHHGSLEFGSPVVPKTTEAIAVWQLDDASSKLNIAYNHIHGALGTDSYTQYIKHLSTELYRSPYTEELTNEDIPF